MSKVQFLRLQRTDVGHTNKYYKAGTKTGSLIPNFNLAEELYNHSSVLGNLKDTTYTNQ